MTRIAIGGFLHETNTFAPTKAAYADFVHGGGWPAMTQGADVLKTIRNINVGLAGFVGRAEAWGWELVPTIFSAASPSAHVTEDAHERIARVMVDGTRNAAPGAMPADTSALPWTKLRPGIRLKPNGPAFVTSVNSRSRSLATG